MISHPNGQVFFAQAQGYSGVVRMAVPLCLVCNKGESMKIGIIGSGNIGSALAGLWARKGHEVLLSFSRDPAQLTRAASEIGQGVKTGTPQEAVAFGDVVLLAVPWQAVDAALQAAGSLAGKTVIACVNPLTPDLSGLEVGTTTSGAEEIARKAAGAHIVEAFLNVFAGMLASGEMQFGDTVPTVFYCGDDAQAKSTVRGLIEDTGLEAVDAGPLRNARFVEPTAMLVLQLGAFLGYGREWKPGEFTDLGLKMLRR